MVPLESRTGEYAQATLFEDDPDVVMFLTQPATQTLAVLGVDGKRSTVTTYTPDFLVIRKEKIEVVEVRSEDALVKEHQRRPYQVYLDAENDQWHNRAAEAHFKEMGIDFRIVCIRHINSIRVENVRFLEDYARDDAPIPDLNDVERLKAFLDTHLRVPFYDLLKNGFDADLIFASIVHGHLLVDLDSDQLHVPQSLTFFASAAVRALNEKIDTSKLTPVLPLAGAMAVRAGTRFNYAGRDLNVILATERELLVQDERGQQETWSLNTFRFLNDSGALRVDASGAIEPQYAHLSKQQIERAQRRLDALRNQDTSNFSTGSLERFASQTRSARNELEALVALTDEVARRGNRVSRLSERSEEIIWRAINEKYNTKEAPSQVAAFMYYKALCDQVSTDEPDMPAPYVVSATTFYARVKKYKSDRDRYGKRKAYQNDPIKVAASNQSPVHATRAHEGCYIDGTTLNLATVSGAPGNSPLMKPYLTVAQDCATGQTRAMLLLYEPHSAATVLLLLRDYVRRNGRLPRFLSLDNAKEFKSQTLRAFCRLYGIHLRYRPPGQPRGAAPVESLQGAVEKEILCLLEGNTISLKDPRLTTKSMNGFNHAVHTLVSAFNIIEEYLFKTRANRISPALGCTPLEYEGQLFLETGQRKHIFVRYDETLLLLTSPHAKRPMHIVDPRRGVWVDGLWYTHADLRGLPKRTKVEVRVEPFAARVVYVCVNGHWKAAVGLNSRHLDGRTRREVAIVARQHTKTSATAAKADRLEYRGQGFNNYLPEAYDSRLAEQQKEQKYLLSVNGLLGALKPEMRDTGDDVDFNITRDPTPYGLQWGGMPTSPIALAPPSAVAQPDHPPMDEPNDSHLVQEGLVEDAFENFM